LKCVFGKHLASMDEPSCTAVANSLAAALIGDSGPCFEGGSECGCAEGFVGPSCEYSGEATCNNHGIADYTGECTCISLWVGDGCQYSDRTTCSDTGTAQRDGSCQCRDGQTADNCSEDTIYETPSETPPPTRGSPRSHSYPPQPP
jgi:hypothetical protein